VTKSCLSVFAPLVSSLIMGKGRRRSPPSIEGRWDFVGRLGGASSFWRFENANAGARGNDNRGRSPPPHPPPSEGGGRLGSSSFIEETRRWDFVVRCFGRSALKCRPRRLCHPRCPKRAGPAPPRGLELGEPLRRGGEAGQSCPATSGTGIKARKEER